MTCKDALRLGLWIALAMGCSTRQTARDAAREDAGGDVDGGTLVDAAVRDATADAVTIDAPGIDAASIDAASVDAASATDAPVSCTSAIAIAPGDTLDGTTVGAGDDLSPGGGSCPSGSADGNDVLYDFHVATSGTYRFVVVPSGSAFDPMLYVVSDCAGTSCVDGTVLNGPGEMETLDVTANAGADVLVVVDGELFSEGAYQLSLMAR